MATLDPTVETGDRLSFTLFLAIGLHALVLLGVGFSVVQGSRVAPTLNVTLATHATEAPKQADFLAQSNQEASGTSETPKELTAADDAVFADPNVQQTTPIEMHKTTEANSSPDEIVKTSAESSQQLPTSKEPTVEPAAKTLDAEDIETPPETAEKAALMAKRDRLNQQEAMRPRIRRMTAVSAIASKDAEYLNQWNETVEAVGNKHFPKEALHNHQFGELRLAVLINPNGTIDRVEILESATHAVLNQAALQIVHLAAPFNAVPAEVMAGNDKLEIIRTWKFEITGLSTN
ncbi:MAG TPA: TonB family protein [Cellvibrionaceae bacterium]